MMMMMCYNSESNQIDFFLNLSLPLKWSICDHGISHRLARTGAVGSRTTGLRG